MEIYTLHLIYRGLEWFACEVGSYSPKATDVYNQDYLGQCAIIPVKIVRIARIYNVL